MIQFDRDICGNLDAACSREWLETNGIGGFASSSINCLNTRRYHGLLVAATKPPVGRYVLLSRFEEMLLVDDRAFPLSSNRYPGVIHPEGFRYLQHFRLDPFPIFTYQVEGLEIVKSLFMVYGENTTVLEYEIKPLPSTPVPPQRIAMQLRPLIAFRDYHSLTHENGGINATVKIESGLASITPYEGLSSLHLAHSGGEVQASGVWYRNFEYEAERERGLDFHEDLFNPLVLTFDLSTDRSAAVIASTEIRDVKTVPSYRQAEIERRWRNAQSSPLPSADEFARDLALATDQYIVARGDQKTVIAGYHWFSDWGRDTMIALPGLTLPAGRYGVARSILRTFAKSVNQGMLPNRFPDAGESPEYNTVDATLWFFEAIGAYLAYTSDLEFVRVELYPVLADIVSWHVRGTRYGIKMEDSGLLTSGEAGVQLTWMDAKVGDWVVTPRRGKPVEIQALWYNALCVMQQLAEKLGDDVGRNRYRSMATQAESSFNRLFWNEKENCLCDVVNEGMPDESIRPNQIFAVSLKYTMLSPDRAKAVVEKVRNHLLTPYGLRTLAPSDPQYRGRYGGDTVSRDGAYHQGTVWPWLFGPFFTAYMRVNAESEASRAQAAEWLAPLRDHLRAAGLGHISEVFDGDPPHRPGGCIAQAWSAAEVFRTYVEDVCGLTPKGG